MARTVLIDAGFGNLHSAEKAFQRMARETDGGEIVVSGAAEDIAAADRLVLPGDGAFPACMRALRGPLEEALREAVEHRAIPFLGICIGMQLMAREGHEYETVPGLGWIDGHVVKIEPSDLSLTVPHMGWNDLVIERPHPLLDGIATGDHAYFVHSYHMAMDRAGERLAHVDHGGDITAIVAKDNAAGMQFHPEKSQEAGLRLIANFLGWAP
ncbi:imidazole glycerol phosphate synthase subunit HisH [Roseicyclus sp. F158]|uniref:Imidazole glycerol phosphate synthase subunit HisH n=1 Tax=Tropicimonas omnivorans TaxID=3075590 RepID=A0ABU3DHS9_9RHOB|nr:imidazole glycerol phosphate synthase subunit HisH [Roseicyclus sp. F158]MDT0683254.1 imidazole glycerol phosphate synthase subunit HisH [Roseicyclus sp. F158]